MSHKSTVSQETWMAGSSCRSSPKEVQEAADKLLSYCGDHLPCAIALLKLCGAVILQKTVFSKFCQNLKRDRKEPLLLTKQMAIHFLERT
jgi:hypothetical protein